MEINLNEARKRLSSLLKNIEKEEIIILKHGKAVARIVPVKQASKTKKLPSLKKFRANIHRKGEPLSNEIIEERNASRY
ncbi:type II toxin-antitoxin system Phd/YefM family antitoxin [Calditrichota bacterium LG25]